MLTQSIDQVEANEENFAAASTLGRVLGVNSATNSFLGSASSKNGSGTAKDLVVDQVQRALKLFRRCKLV